MGWFTKKKEEVYDAAKDIMTDITGKKTQTVQGENVTYVQPGKPSIAQTKWSSWKESQTKDALAKKALREKDKVFSVERPKALGGMINKNPLQNKQFITNQNQGFRLRTGAMMSVPTNPLGQMQPYIDEENRIHKERMRILRQQRYY